MGAPPFRAKGDARLSQERTAGRRASDGERTHLRALELAVRNFITHVEDKPRELFAPVTLALVDECKIVCETLDQLRAARGQPPPESG